MVSSCVGVVFQACDLTLKSFTGKKKKKQQGAANVYLDLSSSSSSSDNDDYEKEDDMETRLRQNAALARSSESSSDDDDEGKELGATTGWGKNKNVFYQKEDEASDPEDEELGEEEAVRLQALKYSALSDADFAGVPGGEVSKESKKQKSKSKKGGSDGKVVERIKGKDTTTSPELAALLADMQSKVQEVRETIQPLLEKVRNHEIATSSGISFLELKNHLLLSYCLNVNFYLLLKAEGKSVKDHPVIDELVRLRLMLDKTKSIDEKLRPQVNRLIKTASLGLESIKNDPSMMRANMAQMLQANDDAPVKRKEKGSKNVKFAAPAETGDSDLYVAPKVSAMYFDEQEKAAGKAERREKRVKERVARSDLMRMVREEFADAPVEISTQPDLLDLDEEDRQELRERAEFEEEYFTRLKPSKADKKRQRQESQFVDELKKLDDFGDIQHILRNSRLAEGAESSGPLAEMARKLREAQGALGEGADGEAGEELGDLIIREQDAKMEQAYEEFLEQNKEAKVANKRAKVLNPKQRKYEKNPNAHRVVEEVEVGEGDDEKRKITQQIENNRGVVPLKKKEIARVRHRKKFEKAQRKISSMVPKVRAKGGRYEGEATGINANVIRSTKLR